MGQPRDIGYRYSPSKRENIGGRKESPIPNSVEILLGFQGLRITLWALGSPSVPASLPPGPELCLRVILPFSWRVACVSGK